MLPIVQNIYWSALVVGYIAGTALVGQLHDALGHGFALPIAYVTLPASAVFAACMALLVVAKPVSA